MNKQLLLTLLCIPFVTYAAAPAPTLSTASASKPPAPKHPDVLALIEACSDGNIPGIESSDAQTNIAARTDGARAACTPLSALVGTKNVNLENFKTGLTALAKKPDFDINQQYLWSFYNIDTTHSALHYLMYCNDHPIGPKYSLATEDLVKRACVLIEWGAEPFAKDSHDKTALDVAGEVGIDTDNIIALKTAFNTRIAAIVAELASQKYPFPKPLCLLIVSYLDNPNAVNQK